MTFKSPHQLSQLPEDLGQKTSAESVSFVLASDATLAVSFGGDQNYGTPTGNTPRSAAMLGVGATAVSNANPVPVSDAGGSITIDGAVAQSGTWNITNVSGTVSLPTGAATQTTLAAISAQLPAFLSQLTADESLSVVLASDQSAVPVMQSGGGWSVTGLPTSLGQKVMASSTSVALASDQPAISVTGTITLAASSSIIGNIRIDQTTPGTTNGIVVNSTTTSTAAYQAEGAVAFGSITGSFVTLFTPTAATKILWMRNNTDAAISVSMDAGSTTNFTLDSGDAISIDLYDNGLNMGATAIQVKYAVGAPTLGSFRINGVH